MEMILNDIEVRVLGCLIEKEMATPDYYPLTLNALTNACNQKSNRDPVMDLEDTEVVRALDRLRSNGLAMQAHEEGSRVPKYRHSLAEKLYLEPEELAVLCELLLRGPQTVGELRGRVERMLPFQDMAEVEAVLQGLMEHQPPLAFKLPRQPGRKESRYQQLMAGEPVLEIVADSTQQPAALNVHAENERMVRLEQELAELREEVAELKRELAAFRQQFE